jgi:transcriptional regulator with XRE-family HTH domain
MLALKNKTQPHNLSSSSHLKPEKANKFYDVNDPELILAFILKKLRKVSGLNQVEIADIINVDQTRLSRIENGKQKLEVVQLMRISKFFEIPVDNLVNAKVNFFQIAEKFNRPLPIPKKYLDDRYSKMRDILPIIFFLDQAKGIEHRNALLTELGIDAIFILDPNIDISMHFKLDLLRNLINQKILITDNFNGLIKETRKIEIHDLLHTSFIEHLDPIQLVHNYILNIKMYERNFSYDIKEMSKRSALIKVKPEKHLDKINYEDGVLKNCICDIRSQTLQQLPRYIDLPDLKLTHKECHFHGDKQCIYEIKS